MSQKKNRTQRKPKSEIKLAEERFQNCIVKRNSLNDEARTVRDERNALHDQRNKVMEEIMKYRDEMKSNTTSKSKHQNARNSAQEKAKKFRKSKKKLKNQGNLRRSLKKTRKFHSGTRPTLLLGSPGFFGSFLDFQDLLASSWISWTFSFFFDFPRFLASPYVINENI